MMLDDCIANSEDTGTVCQYWLHHCKATLYEAFRLTPTPYTTDNVSIHLDTTIAGLRLAHGHSRLNSHTVVHLILRILCHILSKNSDNMRTADRCVATAFPLRPRSARQGQHWTRM